MFSLLRVSITRRPIAHGDCVLSRAFLRAFSASRAVLNAQSVGEPSTPIPNRRLFVAPIPSYANKPEVQQAFSHFGQVNICTLPIRPDGKSGGYAFIEYKDQQSATRAYEESNIAPFFIGEREVNINYAVPNPLETTPSRTLLVRDFLGTDEELRTVLGCFHADVVRFALVSNHKQQDDITTGYIDFKSQEAATGALRALNGTTVNDGLPLRLCYGRSLRAPHLD